MARVPLEPGFIRLPGTARNFYNTRTGETLSRHAYDTRFGLLKKQGFTGYKAKAAATPDYIRQSRPAPGRVKPNAIPKSTRRLEPRVGKSARRINAGSTAASYNASLAGLQANPKVQFIAPIARFVVDGVEKFVWLMGGQYPKDQIISGEEAAAQVGLEGEENDDEGEVELPLGQLSSLGIQYFENFAFHVHFYEKYFRPKAEREPAKKRPKKAKKAKKAKKK